MSAREKIAYLRGLIEGQNIAENAGMSKFHEALLGAFETITEEIDKIASDHADLREYVEDLEDEIMSLGGGDVSEMDDDDDDDTFDEDEEEEYEPVTCPECGKDFFYQPDVYDEDEDLLCPHCGKPFKQ